MADFIATTPESPVYKEIRDSDVITIDVTLAITVISCVVMLGGVIWAGLSFAWKLSEIKNELFGMSDKVNTNLAHLEGKVKDGFQGIEDNFNRKLTNVEEKVNSGFTGIEEDLQRSEKELGNLDARITTVETHLTKYGEGFIPARTRR